MGNVVYIVFVANVVKCRFDYISQSPLHRAVPMCNIRASCRGFLWMTEGTWAKTHFVKMILGTEVFLMDPISPVRIDLPLPIDFFVGARAVFWLAGQIRGEMSELGCRSSRASGAIHPEICIILLFSLLIYRNWETVWWFEGVCAVSSPKNDLVLLLLCRAKMTQSEINT